MNKEFFKKNRENLLQSIPDNSLVILFAGKAPQKSADEEYPFTPNRNFYYLTGIDEKEIICLLSKTDGKTEEKLFIHKSNPVLEKWVGRKMSSEEVKEKSSIENTSYIEDFKTALHNCLVESSIEHIYLDLERSEWNASLSETEVFSKTLKEKYPYILIHNIYPKICNLRMIKDEREVEKIRKAIEITDKGIQSLMKNAKAGIKEYELEAHFDFVLKVNGVKDFAFKTIAASDVNGTVLHYSNNDSVIKENSLILFDLGAQFEYYNADISRTFPVSGKFTERQKQIYNIVLKAQLETIEAIRPGTPFQDLNKLTKKILSEECIKIGLIKTAEELSKYYYHGVSHYLGLDTHDVGNYDKKLEPGMVITVEPGLYIEEEKIGIRIEENVLVTADGNEVLSKDIIKTVEEIENFMQNR